MAKKDYTELVKTVYENVGGKENITSVAHCITRLRLKLKDFDKPNTEVIEKTPGVIKVMVANGQYQVVVGNKIEDVYDQFLAYSGLTGGGEVAVDDEVADEEEKSIGSILIDLISGIFAPALGMLSAAGIMKGLLALFSYLFPTFVSGVGAYDVLYTIADGFFYYLPVILGFSAAKKFNMNVFTGMAIGAALVYPDMVALTSGEVIGSVALGFLGEFSWYSTFFGIPIIMPASGYTSSVIPVLLMAFVGSKVEHWARNAFPDSIKMFFVPLTTCTVAVVLGYLIIGPVATVIVNLLQAIFNLILAIPVVGTLIFDVVVASIWMPLVIFGFHWSLVPLALANFGSIGYDFVLPAMIGHSFSLGAVMFAMFLKNNNATFRETALPAIISAFFFGVTEPGIYGVALPDKKAFINACIGSAAGGLVIGITGTQVFMSGGLGVFNWLSYIDSSNVLGVGITYMVYAIIASTVAAVVGFAIEFVTYKPDASKEA